MTCQCKGLSILILRFIVCIVKLIDCALSNCLQYCIFCHFVFQKHGHVLNQEAIAYIDLDLSKAGSEVTQFESSLGFVGLIIKAADMVG